MFVKWVSCPFTVGITVTIPFSLFICRNTINNEEVKTLRKTKLLILHFARLTVLLIFFRYKIVL